MKMVFFLMIFLMPSLGLSASKKDPDQVLVEIQRELIELDQRFEEIRKDLFFPKDSEVLIYLRNNMGSEVFPVKTVDLYLNNKRIYGHTYTDSEKIAFNFSDLQPLYRFEVNQGQYRLKARFTLEADGKKPGKVQEHQFLLQKGKLPRFIEIDVTFNKKQKSLALSEKIW